MKKFILNLIFILPFLSFSFTGKDLIDYFTKHPDKRIKCFHHEDDDIYFLKDYDKCEMFYSGSTYHISFYITGSVHPNQQIEFINKGTSDKPNFEIIYDDPFFDRYTHEYKNFFKQKGTILFYNIDTDTGNTYFYIPFNEKINKYIDDKYHALFYFNSYDLTLKPNRASLNKIFKSKSSEFYKRLDANPDSPKIPTLRLDEIKSIYRIAFEQQKCFKSKFGCVYKTITLLDTIARQNPDIPRPLVMIGEYINHNMDRYVTNHLNFYQVLIYRASDDEKIYVLDPYFLENGVIEYDQWRLEYLKAQNDFNVELSQYQD